MPNASSSRAVACAGCCVAVSAIACVRAVLLTVWLTPALCLLMRIIALHPAANLPLPRSVSTLCNIGVQDVAKGSTASSLGLSAATPSLEALRTLFGHCRCGWHGYCGFECIDCLLAFTSSERIESDYPIAKKCFCVQGLLCPGLYDSGLGHEWFEGCRQGLELEVQLW